MTNKEFMNELHSAFNRHPITKGTWHTVNELIYVLRMEFSDDFCISVEKDGTWSCIPSSKETFIPCATLSKKIKEIKYEEEDFDDKIVKCLIIHAQ